MNRVNTMVVIEFKPIGTYIQWLGACLGAVMKACIHSIERTCVIACLCELVQKTEKVGKRSCLLMPAEAVINYISVSLYWTASERLGGNREMGT